MSALPTNPNHDENWSVSDSSDSMIVCADGPGDNTIRPLTGKLLEIAKAERAKIEAWQKEQAERQKPPPAEQK